MRIRFLLAMAAVACLVAPATAQTPKLGTPTQIEFTDKTPTESPGGVAWRVMEFTYPIEQGDKFQIKVEAFKGADMTFQVKTLKDAGDRFVVHEGSASGAKIDFTVSKGLPGKRVMIVVYCRDVGKANILINKVGEEPAEDAKETEIKKLKAENAELKKKLDDLQTQLDAIKKLLEKKK